MTTYWWGGGGGGDEAGPFPSHATPGSSVDVSAMSEMPSPIAIVVRGFGRYRKIWFDLVRFREDAPFWQSCWHRPEGDAFWITSNIARCGCRKVGRMFHNVICPANIVFVWLGLWGDVTVSLLYLSIDMPDEQSFCFVITLSREFLS